MQKFLLKLSKYLTLSLTLSLSANANSMFTYEQLQDANKLFDNALMDKIEQYMNDNNEEMTYELALVHSYEMPILNISENDLQLFGIENDSIKNMVHQINILKKDINDELNNKIIQELANVGLAEDKQQALNNEMEIMQNVLRGIESGNFTNNMYMQLVNYKLINNLSNVEQILNMQESFGTILYKIQNEQNLEEKKKILESFYLHLSGNNYNNLDILMNYADQNILNNINNILEIQEVTDYIQSSNFTKVDVNINESKKAFTELNVFQVDYDKSLEENKDLFIRSYYMVLNKSVELNIKDTQNFKDVISNYNYNYNYNNNNNTKNSIIEKLRNYHNKKEKYINDKIQEAKNNSENIFKEVCYKQLPLNKLLNVDFDLDAIQEKINKAENIDEKNQAIKTDFIDNIFGYNSKNLHTVLSNNNDKDLEKVYNILNSEKVANYMTSDVIQLQTINLTKEFYSNIINNNGNQNNNMIEVYTDAILQQFNNINETENNFIKKLNNNNINITNDFARNIKNLLESYANKRLQIIEKETNELLNNPYQYFFNNLININK